MRQTKAATTRRTKKVVSTEARSFGRETALQVDLWPAITPSDGPAEASTNLEVPLSAIVMVTDLIGVVGGEIRISSPRRIQAIFKNTLQALKAVRHLQSLVQGFDRASEAVTVYFSFTLTSVEDLATVTFGSTLGAQEQTRPERVLFIGGICNDARSIPGLQFRDARLLTADLGGFQISSLELLPPSHMEGFVDEPIQVRVAVATKTPPPLELPTTLIDSPAEKLRPASEKTGDQLAVVRTVPIATLKFEVVPSIINGLAESMRHLPRRVVVGSVVTAGLAAIIGLVLDLKPASPSKLNSSQSDSRSGIAPAQTYTSGSPAAVSPGDLSEEGEGNRASKVQSSVEQKKAPASDMEAKASQRQKEDGTLNQASTDGGILSSAEINMTISEAEKLAGDGKYDKAIELYNVVLRHDPKNAAARQGKSRAERNKIR